MSYTPDDCVFEDRLQQVVLQSQEQMCSALAGRPVSLTPLFVTVGDCRGDLAVSTEFGGGVIVSGITLEAGTEVSHYWYEVPTDPQIRAAAGLS